VKATGLVGELDTSDLMLPSDLVKRNKKGERKNKVCGK
jgi:hypothetical protein